MSLTKLKKTEFIPFLDNSATINTGSWVPVWKRIDLSTIFSLNPNPQVNTLDYISYEAPVDVVDRYQPELPQEIAIYQGNPVYDFVFALFHALPTGSAATVPVLICFGGTGRLAWQVQNCTLVLGELNPVDGKLSFSLKLGGNIEKGTYTITSGVPVYSSSGGNVLVSSAAWSVTPPVKSATPQATFTAGTGYTGAITWTPTPSGTFAGSTSYTAAVVLTAATGYAFDPGFNIYDVTGRPASGFTAVRNTDTQVTLSAVYAATAA